MLIQLFTNIRPNLQACSLITEKNHLTIVSHKHSKLTKNLRLCFSQFYCKNFQLEIYDQSMHYDLLAIVKHVLLTLIDLS